MINPVPPQSFSATEVEQEFRQYVRPEHQVYLRKEISEACSLAETDTDIRCPIKVGCKTNAIRRKTIFSQCRNQWLHTLLLKMSDHFDDVVVTERLPPSGPQSYAYLQIVIGGKALLHVCAVKGNGLPRKAKIRLIPSLINPSIEQLELIPTVQDSTADLIPDSLTAECSVYGIVSIESSIRHQMTNAWIRFPEKGYKFPIGAGINLLQYKDTSIIKAPSVDVDSDAVRKVKEVDKKSVRLKKIRKSVPKIDENNAADSGGEAVG
jgi:hypothetical protein